MPGLRDLPTASVDDRPRERLWRHGAATLTAVELLAIVIGTGTSRSGALQVASALADATGGSLRRLATRAPQELMRTAGIGRAKAGRLVAALELGYRLSRETRPGAIRIRSPEDATRAVHARLRDLEVEEFHILALNSQHDLLKAVLVTRGVLDGSLVHPREVFRAAMAEAAAGIILVHNHPSGDPTPSPEDRAVTRQLVAAGNVVGIPVLDHLIVAGDRWVSFASQGLL